MALVASKYLTVIYCSYYRPTVCTVAKVHLPVSIFFNFLQRKQDFKTQHWTELLRTGIFAVKAGILKKNLMGVEGEEEEEEEIFLDPPSVGCSLCTSRLQ